MSVVFMLWTIPYLPRPNKIARRPIQARSALINGFSISGHMIEIVVNNVDAVIIAHVEKAGRRPVRRTCQASHAQAPATASTDSEVIHQCIWMNEDSKDPVPASTVAGSINGSTQQAPQASAPVDTVNAAAPAALVPDGSLATGSEVEREQAVAQAQDDRSLE